jgi:eukaryotic-like serine/threonine-protein kinase
MPRLEGASDSPPPERPRPGQISALLAELVHAPEVQPQAGWARSLRPGAVIGRFELVREVGRGGFGVVWEARDRELGRAVAFKAISPRARPELAADLLLREAEAAALCSHPNIVTLHDLGRCEHGPYLVLELLRGETLAARLTRGPLGVGEALRVGVEVSKGLAHAHAHGVIHRDLTPRNVFLCEDGQVKVLDLGMARAFGHRRVDGGTPGHMAPEQLHGAPEDERTDVYALGMLLFQMLTGEAPPRRSRPLEVPALPALGTVIARALEEDPVERQRDAGELLAALSGLQHELERASSNGAAVVVRRRRLGWTRLAAFAAGLVLLAGAALGVALRLRSAPTTPTLTRVVVLPFANLSGDDGQEYLGHGIAQGLAGGLSKVVPVVTGPSVERIARTGSGAQAIGRELNAEFVIQGGVWRIADRIRVNVVVVRAADSRQMWSDEMEAPFDELLDLQQRLISRVVHAVGFTLAPGQPGSSTPKGTSNARAYDEFLQGEFATNSIYDRANVGEAQVHYERAVALDPGFTWALARLAGAEATAFMNYARQENYERAQRLLERALRIDPHLGIARAGKAYLRAAAYDWQGAVAGYQQVVRDQPLDSDAWDNVCWSQGRVWPRRLADAERACVRARELNPSAGVVHYHLAKVLAFQGKFAEAESALQQAEKLGAPPMYMPSARFLIAMEKGRYREALAALSTSHLLPISLRAEEAAALANIGQLDEAFARLEEALTLGNRDVAEFRNSPWYEPLRKDPRFEPLLAKHGLGR